MKYTAIVLTAALVGLGIWASVSRLDPADEAAPEVSVPRIKVAEKPDHGSNPSAPGDSSRTNQRSQQEPAATGSVEGRVIYNSDPQRPWRFARYYVRDPKEGALAEAVVALSGIELNAHSPSHEPQTVVMDQKNFQFIPETLAIRSGDRVKFLNSDPVTHNVYSRSPLQTFDITLQGPEEIVETFERAGGIRQPVWLGCHFHGSMRAWIYVFDHSWFAVTGPDGRFRLEDVPAGVHRLQMVHPAGELRFSQQVRVESDQAASVEIRVSPDNRVTSDE